MDVFGNCLQGSEVLDVINTVACLCEESLVDDDTETLIAVTDGAELAVCIIEVVCIEVELVCDLCVLEVEAEVTPCVDCGAVTYDEECRRIGLVHLSGKCLLICTGSSGNDLYGNACLSCICCCDFLKDCI